MGFDEASGISSRRRDIFEASPESVHDSRIATRYISSTDGVVPARSLAGKAHSDRSVWKALVRELTATQLVQNIRFECGLSLASPGAC